MLREWILKIRDSINFSFVKFGDGELLCLTDNIGYNCDLHDYSPELKNKLDIAWKYLIKNESVFITLWGEDNSQSSYFIEKRKSMLEENKRPVDYGILLNDTYEIEKINKIADFYLEIRNSSRCKIHVAPERLSRHTTAFLKLDFIVNVPLINCFNDYDRIYEELSKLLVDDCIVLFSSGMPTKSLIADSLKQKNNITCIDIGSSLDPLFLKPTRSNQSDINFLRNIYHLNG